MCLPRIDQAWAGRTNKMCSKEEVREVVREVVTPVWAKRLLGAGVALSILFLGWLSYETHMQDEARLQQSAEITKKLNEAAMAHAQNNRELSSKIDNIRFIFASSVAEATSRVDRLELEVSHVKELAVSRSDDRWTGKDAKARNDLVDERYRARELISKARNEVVDRRLKEIEDTIKEKHQVSL